MIELCYMADTVHAVGTIIENEKGEMLLLKRHKNDPEGETWGLVGGKIDKGEDAIAAAVRETKEEINLDLKKEALTYIESYHWDRNDLDIYFEVFQTKIIKQESDFVLPEDEVTEYLWVTPQEALKKSDLMQGLYPILKDLINT